MSLLSLKGAATGGSTQQRSTSIGVALATIACLSAPPSLASSSTPGTIVAIGVEDGKAFFYTNGTRSSDTPSCHRVTGRWVFDASTPKGQAMLSFVMTQYASGKPVIVEGHGTCADWEDTESVRYIWSANP